MHLVWLQIAVVSVQRGHESGEPFSERELVDRVRQVQLRPHVELQVRQPNLNPAAWAHREAPGHAVHLQVADHLAPFLALVLERLLDTLRELLVDERLQAEHLHHVRLHRVLPRQRGARAALQQLPPIAAPIVAAVRTSVRVLVVVGALRDERLSATVAARRGVSSVSLVVPARRLSNLLQLLVDHLVLIRGLHGVLFLDGFAVSIQPTLP